MSTLRDACRALLEDMAGNGITAVPAWRERLSERTGRPLSDLSPAIDTLESVGFIRRVRPRLNDEWVITDAGYHAWWLYADDLPDNPEPTSASAPSETSDG